MCVYLQVFDKNWTATIYREYLNGEVFNVLKVLKEAIYVPSHYTKNREHLKRTNFLSLPIYRPPHPSNYLLSYVLVLSFTYL